MDIRRGCSAIGLWGRYVFIRKRMLATEGRQLKNEEKRHDLCSTGETMKMNVTSKERSAYGK
jgi:hypothetical protein